MKPGGEDAVSAGHVTGGIVAWRVGREIRRREEEQCHFSVRLADLVIVTLTKGSHVLLEMMLTQGSPLLVF